MSSYVPHIDMNTQFNIGDIEFNSEIYGPGKRTVIWFQGCTIGCRGCWNTQFQSTEPNRLLERNELLKIIKDHGNDVTFLGGEPLLQSANLLWLIKQLKALGIRVMLYTGYEPEEIEQNGEWAEICAAADILIPGRYIDSLRDTNLRWRGSSNQKVVFNHDPKPIEERNEVEIIIREDGSVSCMGYPSKNMREHISSLDYTDRV